LKAGAFIAAATAWGALAAVTAVASASSGRAEEPAFALTVRSQPPAQPVVFRVRKDDAVMVALSSEIAAEIHLHGYNLEARLAAGGTATWRFAARATGRYPINVHRPGETAGHRHAPPLAYLEVRPR